MEKPTAEQLSGFARKAVRPPETRKEPVKPVFNIASTVSVSEVLKSSNRTNSR